MKVMLWNKKTKEHEFIEDVKMVIPLTTIISVVFPDETTIRFDTAEYSLEGAWIMK